MPAALAPNADDLPPERPAEDVLEEIRENRDIAQRAWRDVREEGRKNVLCVAGEVWAAMDPAGLEQRQKAKRPAASYDELGQYINQTGNDVKQNKRSIRATPVGNGANQKTAEFRQARIRQIEYESNAQRDVYSPIFDDTLTRSYGFGRIISKRISDTSKRMKLLIESFPNPDVVLPDPYGAMLAQDCSKIQWCLILDASRTRKQFKREFGADADIVDFTEEHARVAPDWIRSDSVTLAEYWCIEKVRRRVVYLKIAPDRGWFVHKLPRVPLDSEIVDEDIVDVPYVGQYLTNGVELLSKRGQPKRTHWPGKSVPIFSCFGKVLYVPGGAGTERRILSQVTLAREPAMGMAYATSCQLEAMGGVPRATFIAYEGQLRGHETEWQKANYEPVPYLVAKATTPESGGTTVLPLPVKQNWDPPLQNIEMVKESTRRAVQAAMGTSPLPTEAQRQNQKSGKALDSIRSSGQNGSFHFVDHLDGMITRVGQMLNELIPYYDDTVDDVPIRTLTDKPATQRINDPSDPDSITVDPEQIHDITISVGPYAADERQASSEFADAIIGNSELMQTIGPEKGKKVIAEAVRLKDVGPIGDSIAEIIDPKPPEEGQPPTPEQVQMLQAQLQQAQQQVQEATTALQTDQAKQASQVETARIKAEADAQQAMADTALKQAEADLKWQMAQLDSDTRLTITREQEATKLTIAREQIAAKAVALAVGAAESEAGRAHQSDEAAEARAASAEMSDAERAFAAEQAERDRASAGAAE